MRMIHRVAITAFFLLSTVGALAQTNEDSSAYDIVSVKPSPPGSPPGGVDPLPSGTGYKGDATTVKSMISVMYRIPIRQIVGGPEWLGEDKFDVAAISDQPHTTDELHLMFQKMLADRFHLKVHTETKAGRIYALAITKSGAKLTPSSTSSEHNIPITNGGSNQFIGSDVRMNFFCWWLGLRLQNDERPVVDQTGLTGAYDFTLFFRPQLPPDATTDEQDNRPTIFDALRDELGLELIPKKGPVEYLVIDHIERPSEN